MSLTDFQIEVLSRLPFRNGGASVAELADDILGENTPGGRARVKNALVRIEDRFGPFVMTRGRDEYMHWRTTFYAIHPDHKAAVFAACGSL